MRTYHKLKTATWSANGGSTIELAGLPTIGPDGQIPYLLDIELLQDTTVTTGATAITVPNLHNYLSSFTMQAGGPWGPVNLNGEELAVQSYLTGGKPLGIASDTAGDTAVGTSATAATRKVRSRYSFEALGPEDDPFAFCPPCSLLRTGSLELRYSAAIANTSAQTTTFYPVASVVWRKEARSVPRVRTIAQALVGSGQSLSEFGLLLRFILYSEGTDQVAADFTGFRLFADGYQLADVNRPLDIPSDSYGKVSPQTANNRVQNHFCEAIGGGFTRAQNVYPQMARPPLGDLPVAGALKYQYDGAPTVANWQVLYTIAEKQTENHAIKLLTGCGCSPADLVAQSDNKGRQLPSNAVLIPLGRQGDVLPAGSRLSGFTGIAMVKRDSPSARIAANLGHKLG